MAIILTILIQRINLSMIIWINNKTAWFSFLLFLIFLGGLIVLFIYITRLASNEKFQPNWQEHLFSSAPLLIIVIFIVTINPSILNKSIKIINTSTLIQLNFSFSLIIPIRLVIIYLLITLIVVVKISSKIQGPLRSTTKNN